VGTSQGRGGEKGIIMKRYFIILLTVLIFGGWIDPFKDEVEKGNKSYETKDSKKALEHYKEAEKYAPDEKQKGMLDFNRGDAHYQLENYDIALDKFKSSISSENPDVQKKALFNMGNTYLKQKKYKEAAESFIKALEVDPNYDKAKKNLEYLLKEQKNKDQDKDGDSGKSGDRSDKKDNSGNKNKEKESADNEKKMNDIQARNLLDSMKNKPVRKQKGKGDGSKYLEKYW
jgi:tetratricopeptide (TPR) repeat protein